MNERPYEKLLAWREAHLLCLSIYGITNQFPKHELYSLVSQMRRASYSVPMNIAEGNAKRSPKEKQHYFEISLASLDELHYQSRLAHDLGYIQSNDLAAIHENMRKVSYLITRLRSAFSRP